MLLRGLLGVRGEHHIGVFLPRRQLSTPIIMLCPLMRGALLVVSIVMLVLIEFLCFGVGVVVLLVVEETQLRYKTGSRFLRLVVLFDYLIV